MDHEQEHGEKTIGGSAKSRERKQELPLKVTHAILHL